MKVFGVVGWKNSGKTGLVERLVAEFTARGLSVSTLKHAHHNFDIDQPGRDSHRHRTAGARQVLLTSSKRWALMSEGPDERGLHGLLAKLDPVDLVIVEGFKGEAIPKIEARRAETAQELIASHDPNVVGVATDTIVAGLSIPTFDLNDTKAIADFVWTQLTPKQKTSLDGSGDCFALPPGVDWIKVDVALDTLKASANPAVEPKFVALNQASGRILAKKISALRDSPPLPNTAVDGYGFAHDAVGNAPVILPLAKGRAAPGEPWEGSLTSGHALRVLTGGPLPRGVDTVVLQEQVTIQDGRLHIARLPRKGANTRQAGEDTRQGQDILQTGIRLGAPELALISSVGVGEVSVFERLRVAVLSTGNELQEVGKDVDAASIYDANRPMLLELIRKWGHEPVDLGLVPDNPDDIAAALDDGTVHADVILTSGGASAGDEDHIAALLKEAGSLNMWRIAIKPGRPLALGHWQGQPVFGLPGNPVAAFVCALVFARPVLATMAGRPWVEPVGFNVPAAFTKSKKQGRHEFLRARLNEKGAVETFSSEGSGRISGLAWADGLVELGFEAAEITPGTPVRYIPFSSFGL